MRHVPSLEAEARKLPVKGWNRTMPTLDLWEWRVERQRDVLGSHSLTRLSLEPEAMRPFVGCQSTERTSQPWPERTRSSTPSLKFHILMRLSSPALTNLVSLGENLNVSKFVCEERGWVGVTIGLALPSRDGRRGL